MMDLCGPLSTLLSNRCTRLETASLSFLENFLSDIRDSRAVRGVARCSVRPGSPNWNLLSMCLSVGEEAGMLAVSPSCSSVLHSFGRLAQLSQSGQSCLPLCDSSPQRRVCLDDYRSEGFLKVNDLPTSSQRARNVHPVILRSKIGLMRRDLPRAWLSCKLHCLILSGEGLRENIFCS